MSEKPAPRFFDSTVAILATQVSGLIAVFFINLIISRQYGESGKGYVSLIIYTAELLFYVANLALGFTTQYFLSKKSGSPRALYSNMIVFSLLGGVIVLAGFAATFDLWRSFMNGLRLYDMLPCLALVLGLLVQEPCSQFLVALYRTGARAVVVLSQRYLVLIALVIMTFIHSDSASTVARFYVVSYFVSSIIALVLLNRLVGVPNKPSWELFQQTMRYGGWIYVSNLLSQLFIHTDFYMISLLGTIEDAGVYSVASGLTVPLSMIVSAVATMFYPKTSSESNDDAAVTTPFYYRQAILVMLPSALVLALLAKPVLMLYGGGFLRAFSPMLVLLITAIIKGLNQLLALHLLGRGKSFVRVISMAITLSVALIANYLLIPPFGLVGAALAMTLAVISENIVLSILYVRLVNGKLSSLYEFRRSDLFTTWHAGIDLLNRLRKSTQSKL